MPTPPQNLALKRELYEKPEMDLKCDFKKSKSVSNSHFCFEPRVVEQLVKILISSCKPRPCHPLNVKKFIVNFIAIQFENNPAFGFSWRDQPLHSKVFARTVKKARSCIWSFSLLVFLKPVKRNDSAYSLFKPKLEARGLSPFWKRVLSLFLVLPWEEILLIFD